MKLESTTGLIVSGLTIAGVLLVAGGFYLEWRVSVRVDQAIAGLDIQTDSNIVSMKGDIQANKTKNDVQDTRLDNAEDNNERTQRQLEEVARILMSE